MTRDGSIANRLRPRKFQDSQVHIVAAFVLLLFAFLRLPAVDLPFFWDATWVYAPAIKTMSHGIPSLLADTLPPHLSRGHPLFFHFIMSAWSRLFGFSPSSIHLACLIISMTALYMVYRIGREFIHPRAGLLAMVICSSQEIFLAQATQALPEMLLALLVLATIYFFLKESWWPFVLSGTGLLLTKESGLVTFAVLFAVELGKWYWIPETMNRRRTRRSLVMISLPVLLAAMHFIYQKYVFGWFYFPEHIGSMVGDLREVQESFVRNFSRVFINSGRRYTTIVALATMMILSKLPVRTKITVVLTGAVIYFLVDGLRHSLVTWQLKSVLIIALIIGSVRLFKLLMRKSQANLLAPVILYYLFGFILFTSVNVFTGRYILNMIPLYSLLMAFILSPLLMKNIPFAAIIAGVILTGFFSAKEPSSILDVDLNYSDAVKTHMEMTDYFYREIPDTNLILGTLLEALALNDRDLGYIRSDQAVKHYDVRFRRDTAIIPITGFDIVINTNLHNYLDVSAIAPGAFRLLHSIEKGEAKLDIYSRYHNSRTD